MTITALVGSWDAKCEVCGILYHKWCGSSPCCGSVTTVVNHVVTPEEQAEADEKLRNQFIKTP